MTDLAQDDLKARQARYARLMALLEGDPPMGLRAAAREMGITPQRASQIRKAGYPTRPTGGRPKLARTPDQIERLERLAALWRGRAQRRAEAGMDPSHALSRASTLEAEIAQARKETAQ